MTMHPLKALYATVSGMQFLRTSYAEFKSILKKM
uniref:Uncharacterized protein n=1 Tax=Anguilla anguilla TaxID=7936 RepID=A0A0E9PYF0_ANGAN